MPNFNPLTNAVGGAGATSPNAYYNSAPTNFGEYQFIKLTEIVENFVAAYVGEGKILSNVLKGDVNFHAHRALQELSYDVLKSCKSHEIEVCPSLIMPLPHDYVNYVKLTSVDANGIEHIIYPTRHTSHPFAIEQDDCAYEFNTDGTIKHQRTCPEDPDLVTCSGFVPNLWVNDFVNFSTSTSTYPYTTTINGDTVTFDNPGEHYFYVLNEVRLFCVCLEDNEEVNCGDIKSGSEIYNLCDMYDSNLYQEWVGDCFCTGQSGYTLQNLHGGSCAVEFPDVIFDDENCTLDSNAWTNYSSSGSGSTTIDSSITTSLSVDADNYFQNVGQRYGLQPEHAQINGSFFIDCLRGNIHFGSNFSGQTIILHYISDHHGTSDEEIVHKFAEEAMYKWIAYGCLVARADVPEYVIQRFKKEKFAETRKAKIRLSNIKIEEISQIMRNRSKWIKH